MRAALLIGVLMASLDGHAAAAANTFTGRFTDVEAASVSLNLTEAVDGGVSGQMSESGQSLPVTGRRQGAGLTGTVGVGASAVPFTARFEGQRLVLEIGPAGATERLGFARAGTSDARQAPAAATASSQRRVVINDTRLTDATLQQIENAYRIRIPDAEYWYDRVLGAWGPKGGPTMGFIVPGLALGGPLRPDASGPTATGIFVNGRELHPNDVGALQRITGPIMPGRYFINASGLAGFEGGPPQWNLAAMAAQSAGGDSHSWQSRLTGASGLSGGGVSAVFLPNGGITSTGPN